MAVQSSLTSLQVPLVLEFEVHINRKVRQAPSPLAFAGAMANIAAEAIQEEFELWEVENNLNNGRFDVRKSGRRMRSVAALNPAAKAWLTRGDIVLVGYYHRDRQRPYIKSDGPLGKMKDTTIPIPPFVFGLWQLPQGNSRLDFLAEASQTTPVLDGGSSGTLHTLTPNYGGLTVLGAVVFNGSNGAVVAVYWPRLVTGTTIRNYITAIKLDGSGVAWEVPVGPNYTAPTGFQDLVAGQRLPWLAYDPQYKYLWATGWGSGAERNKTYLLNELGQLLDDLNTGIRLVQSSVGAGHLVKSWHSQRPPTYREGGDDSVLRAWRLVERKLTPRWTWDPQGALPGYQIATSHDGQSNASPKDPFGRWPIDSARRQVVVFVGGSKKLANSNAATMVQMQYGGGAWGDFQQIDDTRTTEHQCKLVALDIDTGIEKWSRNWIYQPSHIIDVTSCDNFVAVFGEPTTSPFYPNSGDSPYAPDITYQGIASQDSLIFSPSGSLESPSCYTTEEPPGSENYVPHIVNTSYPIIPLIGVSWGGGGVWDTPNIYGTFQGPKYDFWAPGHPRLCPMPFEDMERGPVTQWPTSDPDLTRLDPVGGALVQDSSGTYWSAVAAQGNPVCVGANRALVQYQGQTETVVPPSESFPCTQWTDRVTHWDSWMLPDIVHTWRLDLVATGPNGEGGQVVDISQATSFPNSEIEWPLKANVYQLVPFALEGRLVVVRDWHTLPLNEDLGHPDNQPYPVLQVFDMADLSSHIALYPLLEDVSTYTYEPDPEGNPGAFETRRKYDHYVDPRCLCLGKGAADANGQFTRNPWCLWRHIVRDRETDSLEINEVLISFDFGAPSVTRRKTASGEFGRPESIDAIGTACVADNSLIFCPSIDAGGWPVVVKTNT